MPSIKNMGRLSVVTQFGMSSIVSSFDGRSMMRWMRGKSIIRCPNAAYCNGKRRRIVRLKLVCRVDHGMALIPGLICGIGVVMVIGVMSDQSHWRAG